MDDTPRTENSCVDEEMERLEQAIERGDDRFVYAEERRAFDNAVRKMLIEVANRRGKQTHNGEKS